MKRTRTIITIVALLIFSVVHSQNLHTAKVMGIIANGQQDFAIINDLVTGEVFKTTFYNQGLLVSDEDIQLNFFNPNDENQAKVIKSNLSEDIFCFKENQLNPCNGEDICINYYGTEMVIVRYAKNNFRIVYEVQTIGSLTNSSVRVFEETSIGVSEVSSTSFIVDTDITKYKLSLHEDVISKATSLKSTLTEVKWNSIAVVYESFLNKFRNQESIAFSSDLGQSTAFHLSIYKTICRSLADNSDCNCLPSPLYFGDRTPFMCMKDLNFNVDELKQTLNENEDEIKIEYDTANIKVLKEYLIQQTNSTFTFDEIYFSTFGTQNNFGDALTIGCMQGSALGCCGNYEGCCWYASLACLVHDLVCYDCDAWYCGPYCTPG